MTLLSSHDTKRSEDIRARLVLLSELPGEWERAVDQLAAAARPHAGRVAADDRYLLHQTLIGTGLIDAERIGGYLHKAAREAKRHTSWLAPDEAYEADLQHLIRGVLGDAGYRQLIEALLARLAPPWRRTVLAHKLAQLTMPGVPDLYQGSERELIALVDPDNRRPVDFTAPDSAKTGLVRTVLRLRRDRPELFLGYQPVDTGTTRAVAFARSPDLLVVLATRAVALERDGWGAAGISLPPGRWTDALTGRPISSGRFVDAVGDAPGLLLVRGDPPRLSQPGRAG
jgi:(1->4)-alpha-D-glucan 1-alpha-D-glucosylmutase